MSDIYALGISESDVRAEIEKYRPQITAFMRQHLSPAPHSNLQGDR